MSLHQKKFSNTSTSTYSQINIMFSNTELQHLLFKAKHNKLYTTYPQLYTIICTFIFNDCFHLQTMLEGAGNMIGSFAGFDWALDTRTTTFSTQHTDKCPSTLLQGRNTEHCQSTNRISFPTRIKRLTMIPINFVQLFITTASQTFLLIKRTTCMWR